MKSFLDPIISSLIPMSSDVFMFINFARVSCAQKHCCLISKFVRCDVEVHTDACTFVVLIFSF